MGRKMVASSKIGMTRRGLTNIGKHLHAMQYMHCKVVRDKHFIRNKKRPLMDIIKEDYAYDPKFWGNKLLGGKTVKELCETPEIEIFMCPNDGCNGILRRVSETVNACGNKHFQIVCIKCKVEWDGEIDIPNIGIAETI